jgi:DNA-binding transcriptional LysR family regulator
VELLHRTTRSIKLSEAGERYAAACRRVLVELEEAEMIAAGERSAPRGTLTISAPPVVGEEELRPIVDDCVEPEMTQVARRSMASSVDRPRARRHFGL